MIKIRDSLFLVLIIQLVMLAAMFLDTPVVRQIIGFVYVSFLPGMLILKTMKISLRSIVEELCFSVGLSIAFSMFAGLVANALFPLFGVSQPLSAVPVMFIFTTVLLFLAYASRYSVNLSYSLSLPSLREIVQVAPFAVVPLLAIVGALSTSTPILLLMVLAIVVLIVASVFYKRPRPSWLFPICILVIAVSLIFQLELVSHNLWGWDVFGEFYVFKLTDTSLAWKAALAIPDTILANYNSMLSVTILPTIYHVILNVQSEWIFKIVYFLIYAFVPLSMYQMYKQDLGKSAAFLSAFYFVLFPRFYGEEKRQIIGELFLVLLVFTILYRNITPKRKKLLLTIFGAALVVSHYSISFVFLFCIVSAAVVIFLMKRFSSIKTNQEQVVGVEFILLMLILNISWYTIISTSVERTSIGLFNHIKASFFSDFSNIATRGDTISEFVAPDFGSMSLIYKINYVINKIPYFLIIIGFVALVVNRRKKRIQMEYFPMVLAVISILLMSFVLPFFADAFLAERYYHVSLILLAPVCMYGGLETARFLLKRFTTAKRARLISLGLICLLFVGVFLFKVGFVNEVTGDVGVGVSRSISYNRLRSSTDPQTMRRFYEPYVPDQDLYGARWLSRFTADNSSIYADATANDHVLRAYALRLVEWKSILSTNITIDADAYVYLRSLNLRGLFVGHSERLSNMTDLADQLYWSNKVCSNGGSEVYNTLERG